jgi:predicted esterase
MIETKRAIVAACLLAVAGFAGAQSPQPRPDSLPGRTIARATSGPDTSQTFAIYLPSAYSTQRKWPAIFVMDPRGRAMLGLALFAPAAEKYGFVVISSYNTLSDGPLDPNIDAINAMLSEVQSSLSVDVTRLYLAGFSGTARVGWSFALEAPKNFAGMIAAGASPLLDYPGSGLLLHERGFALALSAGSVDFNWGEVRSAEQRLVRDRTPVYAAYFDGPHSWPPPAIVDGALAWFKMRGMLAGRWEIDSVWMSAHVRSMIRNADSLERIGKVAASADAFAQLAVALQGSTEGADAERRARALEARRDVIALREKQAKLADEEHKRSQGLNSAMRDIQQGVGTTDPAKIVKSLGIPELRRLAVQGDSLERPFAARVLALDAVFLGFYEPRGYLEQKQPARAIAVLEVYAAIAPWSAQQCAFLAQARALMSPAERAGAPECPSADGSTSRRD